LFDLALKRHEALYGSDSPEAANVLIKVGLLRAEQAKLEDAEKLVRQGIEILKRKTRPTGPAVAHATAALGKVLEDRGSYEQAIRTLNEAVALHSSADVPKAELASTLSELANSHFYAGHYKESEALNKQVLEMQRQLYGDRHPLVADTLINLGAIQLDLGNYPEAEHYDRQALDITRGWYGDDHPETASALTILGRALVSEGRLDEATKMLQDALHIQEHVYGKVHPRVASALNELGRTAKAQGKYTDAEAIFVRMTNIYRSVYGDNHYLIGISLSNLGSVYFEQGKFGKSETIFRDVVVRFTNALSPEHLNTAIARVKLGRALLRQKRFKEAEAESRAGYEILSKQASPSLSWLQNARTDLAEEYGAMHQLDLAGKFREEVGAGK
jgi:eukaryotic-like serine/threonine-protein kinase